MFLHCLYIKPYHKMIQEIIVWALFAAALAYLGMLLHSHFKPAGNTACTKGCSSCSAIDIKKIEEQIRHREKAMSGELKELKD